MTLVAALLDMDLLSDTATYPLGFQQVVGPCSYNDLGLLLYREVRPFELRINVILVHLQDFVVTDSPRVGVIHDSSEAPLSLQQSIFVCQVRNTIVLKS